MLVFADAVSPAWLLSNRASPFPDSATFQASRNHMQKSIKHLDRDSATNADDLPSNRCQCGLCSKLIEAYSLQLRVCRHAPRANAPKTSSSRSSPRKHEETKKLTAEAEFVYCLLCLVIAAAV